MASRYQDYLAAQIFSDGRIISYRTLSRALKVHSNTAKQMLYDFYRTQNARKPGSLHATYLLSGQRKPAQISHTNGTQSQDGEDSLMAGSSFLSSSMPDQETNGEKPTLTTIALTREEDLEALKECFSTISSIHIYSLEPGPLNSIQILSDCNRKIAADHNSDDLLETWKTYGTIHNPLAKRRTGARPHSVAAPPPQPVTAAMKVVPKPPITNPAAKPSDSASTSRRGSTPDTKADEQIAKKTASKPPALKRDASSIFKSFAKTKAPPKKDTPTTDVSAAPSPVPSGGDSRVEDVVMKEGQASDDDFEYEADVPTHTDSAEATEKASAARKARTDREAALRKMMDDDGDEPMDDVPAIDETSTTHSPPPEPTTDNQSLPSPDAEPTITISNGRRRGRRKVMKKKRTRDADGFYVTREEAAWESFSEEEPTPQPQMQQPEAKKLRGLSAAVTVDKGPAGGGEKAVKEKEKAKKGGKPGQGNIMSFFAKK